MYQYIAYPFDVAKTNRILGTSFNRECGDNLGKELVAMYERGQFRNGAYRGMLPLAGMTLIYNNFGAYTFDVTGIKLLACTTLTQPLNILMTRRQVINSPNFSEPSYGQVIKDIGANLPKLVTLGYTAALARNAFLMTAFLPKTLGNESLAVDAGFAFGAVLASHPFEVARVLIVCQSDRMVGSTVSTLQSVYSAEGVAGLYKGFIPRTIHLFPLLFSLVAASYGGRNEEAFAGVRTNPLLGSLKLSAD